MVKDGRCSGNQKKMLETFMNMVGAAHEPKSVDLKTKELVSVAISCYKSCL